MLTDYIEQYKKAVVANDKETMRNIERELLSLGMDARTLLVLIKSV